VSDGLGGSLVVGLEHVMHPFTATIATASAESELRRVGNDYLDLVAAVVSISAPILDALRKDEIPWFGWLRISWGSGGIPNRHPNGSYLVERRAADGTLLEQTVVLMAGYRLGNGTGSGGELGLALTMHLGPPDAKGQAPVRVTGLSVSNLPPRPVEFGKPSSKLRPGAFLRLQPSEVIDGLRLLYYATDLAVHGAVPTGSNHDISWLLYCNAQRANGTVFSFVARAHRKPGSKGELEFNPVSRVDLVSAATAPPKVFLRDPQSSSPPPTSFVNRRPVRSRQHLDPARSPTGRLVSSLEQAGVFEVRETTIGRSSGMPAPDPTAVQSIDLTKPLALRSDALSAAHAYLRGDELFQRFTAYGISRNDYFKVARLPLILRHRAPLRGARDGNTVNAQVRPDGVGPSLAEFPGPKPVDPRPQLEVSFGAASLRRRGFIDVAPKRPRSQPTGLAADPRWAWHEFCHVLNYATFGKLEFRFAHSAGDALAAIVADPDSAIRSREFSRHISFPWVSLGRRHDRDPQRGWGCCGRRNLARLLASTSRPDQRRGYFEEQLLSSALFRFYRAIGGDCTAVDDCRRASDYAVYLVFSAIQLFPQSVPVETMEGLVSRLMQMDSKTTTWNVTANWPEDAPARTVTRVGGCVHKVIRWAFERQGLYATDNPAATVEGTGKPPEVDIYIADARPEKPGQPPKGSGDYWPVPLDWGTTPQPWHASAAGIRIVGGQIIVTVRNRGSKIAKDVGVDVWLWPTTGSAAEPQSLALNTIAGFIHATLVIGSGGSPLQDVPDKGAVDFAFNPVGATVGTEYFVLAQATCDEDRSNADATVPAQAQPCATLSTPLIDLVANDNNLGLRILVR